MRALFLFGRQRKVPHHHTPPRAINQSKNSCRKSVVRAECIRAFKLAFLKVICFTRGLSAPWSGRVAFRRHGGLFAGDSRFHLPVV